MSVLLAFPAGLDRLIIIVQGFKNKKGWRPAILFYYTLPTTTVVKVSGSR